MSGIVAEYVGHSRGKTQAWSLRNCLLVYVAAKTNKQQQQQQQNVIQCARCSFKLTRIDYAARIICSSNSATVATTVTSRHVSAEGCSRVSPTDSGSLLVWVFAACRFHLRLFSGVVLSERLRANLSSYRRR